MLQRKGVYKEKELRVYSVHQKLNGRRAY